MHYISQYMWVLQGQMDGTDSSGEQPGTQSIQNDQQINLISQGAHRDTLATSWCDAIENMEFGTYVPLERCAPQSVSVIATEKSAK